MAMYDSEAFWQDFMRRPDAQKALKLEQKILMKEQAEQLSNAYDTESAELKEALLQCSPEVKKLVSPLVKYHMVHRLLHNLLKDCKSKGTSFNDELSNPTSTITNQLTALHQEWKADPKNLKAIEGKWTEICLEAKQQITQDSYKQKEHTWRDIPQEELAERLSKGEIMPRDEWIPGLSKGRRKLDSNSLKQHLTLGEQMRRDGRDCFEKKDFEMALTRFTQGVQLLNWVEGTNENDNNLVEEMYVIHLRNQSQAALKCGKYHEALKACNTILQDIDEHDTKAHYRRGQAYAALGMVKQAKDDYQCIIKSPYADEGAIVAAKAAMGELRQIVNKYRITTRNIMNKTVAEDTFSEGRQVSQSIARPQPEHPPHRKPWFSERAEQPRKMHEIRKRAPAYEPFLDVETTRQLLEDLLEAYTLDEVQAELRECRRLADFEERRILIRIRKYIPSIQMPFLRRYNLANAENGYVYLEAKRLMEMTVAYWRQKDQEVKQLATECWDAVFGELADIDN